MKKILKKIPWEFKFAILVVVLIVTMAQVFTREFTLQYLEDGDLKTESFKSTKDFNERAMELQADGVSYWLHHE